MLQTMDNIVEIVVVFVLTKKDEHLYHVTEHLEVLQSYLKIKYGNVISIQLSFLCYALLLLIQYKHLCIF